MTSDRYTKVQAVIDAQLERDDLTPEDVLRLTLASRLNACSDSTLKLALGGSEPPLNFWGKR